MSLNTNIVQDDTTQANGSGEGKLDSVNEMPSEKQLSYDTYKRALEQRIKFKEENEGLKSRLEKLEQERLESEGKKDEALAYWKTKATEFEKSLKETTSKFGWNQVKSQLSNELSKAGCVDPEIAITLIDKTELNSLEVNDDFTVNKDGLMKLVDSIKKDQRVQKIKLFASVQGVNDMAPASNVQYKEPKKEYSEMSKDDLLKLLKK